MAELKNIVRLSTFHANGDRLATFRLWERGFRAGNNSSSTRKRRRFWNLSRMDSEDCVTPAYIWQQIQPGLAFVKVKDSR